MHFRLCPACTLPVREDRRWCGDCGQDMNAAERSSGRPSAHDSELSSGQSSELQPA